MATEDERLKILRMIQENVISAEQGVQLLEALDEGIRRSTKGRPAGPNMPPPPGTPGKWFRVMVTDTSTGRTRVNVRLPVGLVNAGIKMGAKFAPQVEGLDPAELMQHLNSGEAGQIVDVFNEDESEHIQVFIE